MTVVPVTLLTASVLGIVFVILSAMVSRERGRSRVGLGAGAETSVALGAEHEAPRLLIAMRRQGNFAEYVPISLLLLLLLELNGAPQWRLLVLAAVLVLARLMFTFGLGRAAPNLFRAGGSALQYLMIASASIWGLLRIFLG